jgi:murein DD-endopeptidase MepM/ murein hydrolase activator NlpD
LFTPREHGEFGIAGLAANAAAPALDRFPPEAGRLRTLSERLSSWRRACDPSEWVHDLAEDIGSHRWYRGLATMLGLALLALAFWPDFSRLEAAPVMHVDSVVESEFRSQTILPLALNGRNSRHTAASALVVPVAAAPERPRIALTATLAQGDSFGRMLQRAGVGANDATAASELVAGALPLGEIEPGTRVELTLGPRSAPGQPRALEQLDFRARFDLNLAVSRNGGALALARRAIPVDTTPLRIRGVIGSSLYRSARAAGAPAKAIQQYLQALDSHINLESDILPGDSFDVIIANKRSANGESQAGDVLYAALDRGEKPLAELLRWGKDGQFFSADAMSQPRVQSSSMGWPVNGRITSGYGERYHPILGYMRMHSGVDFGAAWGSPIFAVAAGTVSYAGRHGGHGNYVRLEHGEGLGTGYGHMSRIAVYPGEHVNSGQVIGYVGSTGLSTGPHLHYEMYQNGRTINPLGMRFAVRAQQVDPKELAAFKARIAQLKAVRPGSGSASPAQRVALR